MRLSAARANLANMLQRCGLARIADTSGDAPRRNFAISLEPRRARQHKTRVSRRKSTAERASLVLR